MAYSGARVQLCWTFKVSTVACDACYTTKRLKGDSHRKPSIGPIPEPWVYGHVTLRSIPNLIMYSSGPSYNVLLRYILPCILHMHLTMYSSDVVDLWCSWPDIYFTNIYPTMHSLSSYHIFLIYILLCIPQIYICILPCFPHMHITMYSSYKYYHIFLICILSCIYHMHITMYSSYAYYNVCII